jgi:type I restriction enzyme S subunit
MEKIKNIPSLRFPEFEENWRVKKLGDVMNFKVTNSFSRENLNYENGNVKNIHYGDIHTKFQTLFDITREFVPFINEEISIGRISEDFYCKEGDIIFADASEDLNDVGKSIEIINLNNEKLLSGLHTLLARPIENTFEIGFNGYLLKTNTVRTQIQKESQGSKVLSINVGRVSGINITFPTLKEQNKIANFLTTVEDKLQTLKQKKTLLDQYKKGVMKRLFSQEIRFKDDNENDYPDWEEKKLGDLCNYKNGGSFEKFVSIEGIYNLISLNSIDINGKLKKQHKKVTITDNSLQKGDLIMVLSDVAHGNFLGLTDIIPNNEFVLNQRMAALKPKTDFNSFYLKTFINYNQSYFKLMGQGSSQLNLSKGDVENFIVKLPIFEEQTKIAIFLSSIDEKINHCQEQIANTEVWKKGLLQQMFV